MCNQQRVKKILLRVLCGTILFLNLFLLITPPPSAQEEFPRKPIISVIPYPPGGATDLACRALGSIAVKHFGQPFVPINKAGSMSVVAASFTANEKADGYTVVHLPPPPFCTVPYVFDIAFDPSSLKPMIGWSEYPFFMAVKGDAPWKTLDEFVNYARSNPGLKYSHSGPAAFPHLAMESFGKVAKIKIIGVPFKGDVEQTTALLGGHVVASCLTAGIQGLVDSGKIRLLGTFNKNRVKGYGALTFKEQGYGLDIYSSFLGAFVHKDTPAPIVKKLHDGLKRTIEDQEFIAAMDKIAMPISYMSTHDFEVRLKNEMETCRVLLKELGLQKR